MNTKTMEGLAGAGTNRKLLNTPMRVYKEARRKGDTAVMEQAMKYAGDFAGKAEAYQAKAYEGMKEDAKKAREEAELEREKAIQKRKEEHEKLKERIEESKSTDTNTDTVEISAEGKVFLKDNADSDQAVLDEKTRADDVKTPVTYTKTGETVQIEQRGDIFVSV